MLTRKCSLWNVLPVEGVFYRTVCVDSCTKFMLSTFKVDAHYIPQRIRRSDCCSLVHFVVSLCTKFILITFKVYAHYIAQ